MKNKKILSSVLFSSLILNSCLKKGSAPSAEPETNPQTVKPAPITGSTTPSGTTAPKSPPGLEILNLSGNYGTITINKKFKLTYQVRNNYPDNIENIKVSFENNNFKFELPYPGISTASTKADVFPPCGTST